MPVTPEVGAGATMAGHFVLVQAGCDVGVDLLLYCHKNETMTNVLISDEVSKWGVGKSVFQSFISLA